MDKLIHAALFFPLAFLLGVEFDLSKIRFLRMTGPLLTLLIIALYGGMIEILQDKIFINRSSDLLDFLSDLIGGFGGLIVYYLFFRRFFQKLSARKS